MGIPRASFAWLIAALTVGLVSGLPHVTLANDVGPGKEVRTIRRQLPVLLAESYDFQNRSAIVDAVRVSGAGALAQWHAGADSQTAYLSRRFDRWWLVDSSLQCGIGNVPADLLPSPPPQAQPAGQGLLVKAGAPTCDPYWINDLRFLSGAEQMPTSMGGYLARFVFASNDAPEGALLAGVQGRAPTEAESWMTDGGNSYFFFSGTVQSSAPIQVAAGTTIDVWFPFVLDTSLHYALTIAHADKPIGPIDGTLKDNVVHFVLPAFALAPGAELHGEVEGDAWLHQ